MENKKLYIGLGVLAVAGIGIYLYRKNKSEEASEKKEKFSGASGSKIRRNNLASTASTASTSEVIVSKKGECPAGLCKSWNGNCYPCDV